MIFLNLTMSGFLGVRSSNPQTIDFNEFSLAAITGVNGAGKSTIFQAIEWALFGTLRADKDSVDSIKNDFDDNVEVSLEFIAQDGEQYRIERSRHGNSPGLQVYQASEDGTDWIALGDHRAGKSSIAHQKIEELIGMDEDIFKSVVLLEHRNSASPGFVRADPSQRYDILINMVPELADWDAINTAARDNASEMRAESKRIDAEIEYADSEHSDLVHEIELVDDAIGDDDSDEMRAEIEKVEAELSELENDRNSSVIEELTAARDKMDELKSVYRDRLSKHKAKEESLRNELRKAEDLAVELDHEKEAVEEDAEALDELKPEADSIATRREEIEEERRELTSRHEELSESLSNVRSDLSVQQSKKDELAARLDALDVQVNSGSAKCVVCDSTLSKKKAKEISDDCEHDFSKVEAECKRLSSEKSSLESAIARVEAKIRACDKRTAECDRDAKKHEKNVREIEDALTEGKANIKTLEKQIKSLRDPDVIEAELDSLEAPKKPRGYAEAERRLAKLKDRQSEENPEIEMKRDVLKMLRSKERRLVKLEGELSSLHKRLAKAESESEKLQAEAEKIKNGQKHADWLSVATSSKGGVPARIAANILREIEEEQNRTLSRLENDSISRVEYRTGRPGATKKSSEKQVLDIIAHMPDGAERRFERLSDGEAARVLLSNIMATAKVFNAKFNDSYVKTLLLDEPFGVIDRDSIPAIIDLLNEAINEHIVECILVITHEEEVIQAMPQRLMVTRKNALSSSTYELVS